MTDQFANNDPLAGVVGPDDTNILDDILNDEVAAALPQADAGTAFIRIVTTNGNYNVPIDTAHTTNGVPGYTVSEVMGLANVFTTPGSTMWVNGAAVEPAYVLTGGQSVTIIGPAKGG